MPNRIVREAILSSESVAGLSWAEEVLYRRLMSIVDDFGRCEANPQLLRAKCYPLQIDDVKAADVSKWLDSCRKACLLTLYSVDGKSYLEINKFQQQTRSASKCPAPDINCSQPPTSEHLGVVVVVGVSECGDGGDPDSLALPLRSSRKRAVGKEITFTQWIESLDGADAIPADDPIFEWGEATGIPKDWIQTAWWMFESRYSGEAKRYVDWRAVFRKAVREDWLKVWTLNRRDGGFMLTTAGVTAQREMAA